DLQRVHAAHSLGAESGLVPVLLHVPGKDADAVEIDTGVGEGLALADDVPVDLARNGILDARDRFDGGVDVIFRVLRDVGRDVKFQGSRKDPADFSGLGTHFKPYVV